MARAVGSRGRPPPRGSRGRRRAAAASRSDEPVALPRRHEQHRERPRARRRPGWPRDRSTTVACGGTPLIASSTTTRPDRLTAVSATLPGPAKPHAEGEQRDRARRCHHSPPGTQCTSSGGEQQPDDRCPPTRMTERCSVVREVRAQHDEHGQRDPVARGRSRPAAATRSDPATSSATPHRVPQHRGVRGRGSPAGRRAGRAGRRAAGGVRRLAAAALARRRPRCSRPRRAAGRTGRRSRPARGPAGRARRARRRCARGGRSATRTVARARPSTVGVAPAGPAASASATSSSTRAGGGQRARAPSPARIGSRSSASRSATAISDDDLAADPLGLVEQHPVGLDARRRGRGRARTASAARRSACRRPAARPRCPAGSRAAAASSRYSPAERAAARAGAGAAARPRRRAASAPPPPAKHQQRRRAAATDGRLRRCARGPAPRPTPAMPTWVALGPAGEQQPGARRPSTSSSSDRRRRRCARRRRRARW